MSGILDTIDHAIADHELSADAMRWTPDPQAATGGHVPAAPDIARLFDVPPGFLRPLPAFVMEPWQAEVLKASERVTRTRRAYGAKQRPRR